MNGMGKKIVTIMLAMLLTGCTAAEFLPARQTRASSASAVVSAASEKSSAPQETSSGRELQEPGQVALYRRVGDNPATQMESVTYARSVYQPETDLKKLYHQCGVSKSIYVFIGWFYLDENNQPAKWTGDQDIPVRANEETRITSVFNTYYRSTEIAYGGTLQLYCSIDGNTPVLGNTIAGISDYPLPALPDAVLKKQLPADQAQMRFEGWYSADSVGKPVAKLEDTHVRLKTRETQQVTAVFTKTG